MSRIKIYLIYSIVFSAIILDLDSLSLRTPLGRFVLFDLLMLLFVILSIASFKILKFKELNWFYYRKVDTISENFLL